MAGRSARPDIFTIHGYLLPEVVSALQKAMRRCDEEEAVYWAAEMEKSGFGQYCWTRLKVILSEDIGPAWMEGPAVINALYENWKELKKNGTDPLPLYHAVLLMVRAPKSTSVIDAVVWAHEATGWEPKRPIPDVAYDKHTKRGRQMGRGFVHFIENGGVVFNEDLTQRNEKFRDANIRWSAGKDDPSKMPPTLNPPDPNFVPPGGNRDGRARSSGYEPKEPLLDVDSSEDDIPVQADLGFSEPPPGPLTKRVQQLSQERDWTA